MFSMFKISYRSRLCHQISLVDEVCRLDDNGCVAVFKLLQEELKCVNLNQILSKFIMSSCTDALPNTSFTKLENTIKEKYLNECISPKLKMPPRDDNNPNNHLAHPKQDLTFPLHRLPIDLITSTSLFLNETDIFQFEQCCRLFYKMINNTSYLSKCNNFKRLKITKQRLEQMQQAKHSFFKYSKANELTFDLLWDTYIGDDDLENDEYYTLFDKIMNDCKAVLPQMNRHQNRDYIDDQWTTNVFKSISKLSIEDDLSQFLLHRFPINILFNPAANISNLKNIEMSYPIVVDRKVWTKHINDFETQYLEYEKNLQQRGKNIKPLQCVKHKEGSARIKPRYIHANHVWLKEVVIDLTSEQFFTDKCNPDMKMLTIENYVDFVTDTDRESVNKSNVTNRGLQIETMRLLQTAKSRRYTSKRSHKLCNKKVVIDLLNLQNSLTNLTVEFDVVPKDNHHETQQQAIENVLQKEFFYRLENVNILYQIRHDESVDWFFDVLKRHCNVLKYRFKQLNVGLCKDVDDEEKLYYTLEWNTKIDERILDQEKETFCQMKQDDQLQQHHREKYSIVLEQWLNDN